MAYTAQSDQIEVLAFLADNSGQIEAGKKALALASDLTRSGIAKQCGCTAQQVALWAQGRWSPPTQQRLALLKATAEFAAQYTGRVPA